MFPLWKFNGGVAATAPPPPPNNRFGLIGQLLVHPLPKNPHSASCSSPKLQEEAFCFPPANKKNSPKLHFDIFGYIHPKPAESDHLKAMKVGKKKNMHPFIYSAFSSSPLFCYVVNTSNRIPEINPALGRPATTVCNVIIQTKQFMLSTTQRNIIWKDCSRSSHVQKWQIWKYCKLLQHSQKN